MQRAAAERKEYNVRNPIVFFPNFNHEKKNLLFKFHEKNSNSLKYLYFRGFSIIIYKVVE